MPNFITDPEIENYAVINSTPSVEALAEIFRKTTENLEGASMMVGPLEGSFLQMLVFMTGAKRVLEIGAFSGYSSVAMALALGEGGIIDTCEISRKHVIATKESHELAGTSSKVRIHEGDALKSVENLDGPYDLVFIDADKANYTAYLDLVLPKLKKDGVIAVDNTLWSKRVLDENDQTVDTKAIREFNSTVAKRQDLVAVIVPIRDGLTLIRKAN